MSIAAAKTRFTPEDLLVMPDGGKFELVDGQLVEKPIVWEASYVAGQLYFLIRTFLQQHPLGWLVMEGSYQCFPHDRTMVRKPDLSFIGFDRMPKTAPPPRWHCLIAPDLAVEVVSPRNLFSEIEEKVQDYLQAGVRLVWVIDPATTLVHVHHPNDPAILQLRAGDNLDGESVLPSFSCSIAELFEAPA